MSCKSFTQSSILDLLPSYSLTPLATIIFPPLLLKEIKAAIKEDAHPVWNKMLPRGRCFVLKTTSLDDLTEVADWGRAALVEPPEGLSLSCRIAYRDVIKRVAKWAVLEAMEPCHCIATHWRYSCHFQDIKLDGRILAP